MSSLVVDVLATTVKMNMADVTVKIKTIQSEIMKLKNEVKEFIEDNYIDFIPTVKKDHALIEKTEKLVTELKSMRENINDLIKVELSGSTKELKNLSQALNESNISLELSRQLLELNESLNLAEKYREKCLYIDSAKMLQKIAKVLSEPDSDLPRLNIYEPIKECYHISYGSLMSGVYDLWSEDVKWQTDEEKNKKTSLTIDGETKEVQDLILALYYLDDLPSCMQSFSNTLLRDITGPIINSDCSVYVEEEKVFNVVIEKSKRTHSYEIVLHNLRMLFQFLNQHFNVEIGERTFINLLREHLWEPLSTDLLKNCIPETIPRSSVELQNFGSIENDIKQFENYLLEIGFIRQDECRLTNYVKDIDKLYIDKLCHGYLTRASELMKKDLHDSFKYEPEEIIEYPKTEDYDFHLEMERKLSKNTFQFPPCQISRSAQEILELVRSVLDEMTLSPESCATRLFYTSRNILEEYLCIVPQYHKNFLETIPQQVALFHNNCMYLAHKIMTLPFEYKNRLPSALQNYNITYVDLTLKFRAIGVEYFLKQLKYQTDLILTTVRNSQLTRVGTFLFNETELSFRQCIRQLQLLKTVWLDVLPMNVYCKAVGCVLNSMIEHIVAETLRNQDISAAAAIEMVKIFNMIVNKIPLILPDPDSINRYVSKHSKLLELIKVLDASLKQIEDRWAGGKGPLAREFTPSEMQRLIRALFQNTERRSMLLASIK